MHPSPDGITASSPAATDRPAGATRRPRSDVSPCTAGVPLYPLWYRHPLLPFAFLRPALPTHSVGCTVLSEHGPLCQSDARSGECFGTKRSQVQILSARLKPLVDPRVFSFSGTHLPGGSACSPHTPATTNWLRL